MNFHCQGKGISSEHNFSTLHSEKFIPISGNASVETVHDKKFSKEITLTNPKIIDFFNNHEFEPETMILFFVEILEKFGEDFYKNITSSINTQILNNVLELKQKNQLIIDNMNKINSDIVNSMFIKMLEIKKEYIDDTKMIVSSNTNEKIFSILEKNNSTLIDKTNLLLNEILSV